MSPTTALSVIAVLVTCLDRTSTSREALGVHLVSSSPGSEGRCEYTTARGGTVFLEYLDFMGKGEGFVEFDDAWRVCSRRVSCGKDYILKFENCEDDAVSCDPSPTLCKQRYFPQCCAKCMASGGDQQGMLL